MNIRLIGATALIAALAGAGCATTAPGYGYGGPSASSSRTSCYDCGTVTRIEVASTTTSGVPNATGAVLGGIVGAVAGHEISDKTGGSKGNQNIATAAGAVAGAVAGNAIQNRSQNQGSYNVYVRMNDGRTAVVTQSDLGGIREGSYVRVSNGRAYLR
ncbi:MAG: glycine zipper 2TM domain-containing protein [Luteimonas sp.]